MSLLLATGCTTTASSTPTVAPTTTIAKTRATVAPTTTPTTVVTTTTIPPRYVEQAFTPFATVGGITLQHPAAHVERVGFHQSNHEGAQVQAVLPTAVRPTVLESRERLTDARTAADVVVEPGTEIRAPVSGVVKRSGGYVLYCKYHDDFLVIDPDSHPGWEVKLLHIDGVTVHRGDRVEAGITVVAPRATQLPFESQVDEARTQDPAWPHVHIEVVNPNIRNVPSPGGGC